MQAQRPLPLANYWPCEIPGKKSQKTLFWSSYFVKTWCLACNLMDHRQILLLIISSEKSIVF